MCGEDEAEIQDPVSDTTIFHSKILFLKIFWNCHYEQNMIKCGDYGVRVSEGDVDEMNSMPRPHSNNSSEEDSGFVNSRYEKKGTTLKGKKNFDGK